MTQRNDSKRPDETTFDYAPPVSLLLREGNAWKTSRRWPDYGAKGIGREHIAELLRMAADERLLWARSDTPEVWAPVHAWRALGQLEVSEAIEPLLGLFSALDEGDSDDLTEEMPDIFARLGAPAIPAVAAFLGNEKHGLWPRATATDCLEKIGLRHREARAECVAALTHALQRFEQNDAMLNASLVGALTELSAHESLPLIERAFNADRVDETVCGDFQDVRQEFGLPAASPQEVVSAVAQRRPVQQKPTHFYDRFVQRATDAPLSFPPSLLRDAADEPDDEQ